MATMDVPWLCLLLWPCVELTFTSKDAVTWSVEQHQRKDKKTSPQDMRARLDCSAAASSMVRTKGTMYGQNERARCQREENQCEAGKNDVNQDGEGKS